MNYTKAKDFCVEAFKKKNLYGSEIYCSLDNK